MQGPKPETPHSFGRQKGDAGDGVGGAGVAVGVGGVVCF